MPKCPVRVGVDLITARIDVIDADTKKLPSMPTPLPRPSTRNRLHDIARPQRGVRHCWSSTCYRNASAGTATRSSFASERHAAVKGQSSDYVLTDIDTTTSLSRTPASASAVTFFARFSLRRAGVLSGWTAMLKLTAARYSEYRRVDEL